MTPLAGFVAAIIAGWIIRDPRRAAAAVVVPFLAVLTAQSWIIASGRAVSPPSTVTGWPELIGYWGLQAVFLTLALGIAAELGALRRRMLSQEATAGAGRRTVLASALLAILTAMFLAGYLLDSVPAAQHSADGSPPAQGLVGIVLCIVTFIGLTVVTLRGRRRTAGEPAGSHPNRAAVTGGR
jgi:hypothetical protein